MIQLPPRILVLEDDPVQSGLLKKIAQGLPWEFHFADNVYDASQLLIEQFRKREFFGFYICDVAIQDAPGTILMEMVRVWEAGIKGAPHSRIAAYTAILEIAEKSTLLDRLDVCLRVDKGDMEAVGKLPQTLAVWIGEAAQVNTEDC